MPEIEDGPPVFTAAQIKVVRRVKKRVSVPEHAALCATLESIHFHVDPFIPLDPMMMYLARYVAKRGLDHESNTQVQP